MSILTAGLGEKICILVEESLAGSSERVGRKRPSGAPRNSGTIALDGAVERMAVRLAASLVSPCGVGYIAAHRAGRASLRPRRGG